MSDPQVGDFLHPRAGVVEEQQQGAVAQREATRRWAGARSSACTSSRSRKCVSAGAARFIGMAATRWQMPSISGSRVAMYSNRVCTAGQSLVAGADVVAAVLFEVVAGSR